VSLEGHSSLSDNRARSIAAELSPPCSAAWLWKSALEQQHWHYSTAMKTAQGQGGILCINIENVTFYNFYRVDDERSDRGKGGVDTDGKFVLSTPYYVIM
jgi:hypothetical protein